MPVCYFTVVTRNYLSYADSLYESLQAVSPDVQFYCLVVDAIRSEDENFFGKVRFNILYPTELDIQNYDHMLVYYDAFELCNALKAAAMRHVLFVLGFDTGIYLDSDILVFGSFSAILKSMGAASFGFSPHFISPLPADELKPNDLTFLQAGIFNGGMWIFKRTIQSNNVLNWLMAVSETLGFNKQSEGMFVDQKLICQAAGMFNSEFFPINNAGCNVAYWNLHERTVEIIDDCYFVNSEPLIFFHYSGYKPGASLLSSHTERFIDLPKKSKALEEILHRYTQSIERSELKFTMSFPYRFNELDGVKITSLQRKYYFSKRSIVVPVITQLLLRVARRLRKFGSALEAQLLRKVT